MKGLARKSLMQEPGEACFVFRIEIPIFYCDWEMIFLKENTYQILSSAVGTSVRVLKKK